MKEKRACSRVDCVLQATLEYEGTDFPSTTVNLSLTGALVNTAASPRKAEKVTIVLSAEGEQPALRCPGRVVRADTRGVGIAFDPLSLATRAQLRDLLAARSDDPQAIREEFDRAFEDAGN